MFGSFFVGLLRKVTGARFGDAHIAALGLGWRGSFAGRIDEVDRGRVRGWVFDAKRPNMPVSLDVLVNGELAMRVAAADFRSDLSGLLRDNGCHGFGFVIPTIGGSGQGDRITITVSDRPETVVGAFVRGLPAISPELDDRLNHIFDHITAAHEAAIRQIEKTQARIDMLQAIGFGGSPTGSGMNTSLLVQDLVSAIHGVGQFGDTLDDDVEVALFKTRLERDVAGKRHLL